MRIRKRARGLPIAPVTGGLTDDRPHHHQCRRAEYRQHGHHARAATVLVRSRDRTGATQGPGSGFSIDADGFSVTNNHAVALAWAELKPLRAADRTRPRILDKFDKVTYPYITIAYSSTLIQRGRGTGPLKPQQPPATAGWC